MAFAPCGGQACALAAPARLSVLASLPALPGSAFPCAPAAAGAAALGSGTRELPRLCPPCVLGPARGLRLPFLAWLGAIRPSAPVGRPELWRPLASNPGPSTIFVHSATAADAAARRLATSAQPGHTAVEVSPDTRVFLLDLSGKAGSPNVRGPSVPAEGVPIARSDACCGTRAPLPGTASHPRSLLDSNCGDAAPHATLPPGPLLSSTPSSTSARSRPRFAPTQGLRRSPGLSPTIAGKSPAAQAGSSPGRLMAGFPIRRARKQSLGASRGPARVLGPQQGMG